MKEISRRSFLKGTLAAAAAMGNVGAWLTLGGIKTDGNLAALTADGRAIPNLYVAGADHPPPLGVGHSVVIDPQGVPVVHIGTATDVAVAFVDVRAVERVRRVNPALALRRYTVVPRV